MSDKKILLSGIQPTGRPHIGNYFGAMKQFVSMQDSHDVRIFIANLHALTTILDRQTIEEYSRDLILDLLGIGLDPKKITLFLQSDIPHVTELTWIFNCLVTVPYLERSHAYKDKLAAGQESTIGLFDYPVLMAADILVHDADVVPVGPDQKQHLEITRDIAQKFNNAFKETFKLPEPLIYEGVGTVMGTDGRKMSKSYNNVIPLFASKEEISRSVMKIVTNSEGTTPNNVYSIHTLVNEAINGDPVEFDNLYKNNKSNHKVLKEALIEDLEKLIGPMRTRRAEWEGKSDEVEKIIREGGMKMRKVVHEKMLDVRAKVGLIHHD